MNESRQAHRMQTRDPAQSRTRFGRFLGRHPTEGGLALSVALFIGMLLLAEGAAQMILTLRGPTGIEGLVNDLPMTWVEQDDLMGFRPKASGTERARKVAEDFVVYDFRYTVDAYHRRITPVDPPLDRPKFAAFLGGSYTFGEGVEDDETLPAYFGRHARAYEPYNYAYRAYGPQHVYLQLTRPGFNEEIAQDEGIFIYLFIDHHIDRLIGRLRVLGTWGQNLPALMRGPDGWEHLGRFKEAAPIRHRLYSVLAQSALLKLLKFDWPAEIRPQDLTFTAAIMKAAADQSANLYPDSEFYVIFHPTSQHAAALAPLLDELGVRYFNYSGLFDREPPAEGASYFLADGHPTADANAKLARHIVQDLDLSSPHQ